MVAFSPTLTFDADVPAFLAEACVTYIALQQYRSLRPWGWRTISTLYILYRNDAAVRYEW